MPCEFAARISLLHFGRLFIVIHTQRHRDTNRPLQAVAGWDIIRHIAKTLNR
jgi:hypothetical protein